MGTNTSNVIRWLQTDSTPEYSDAVILDDPNASWQPIYAAVVILACQTSFLLTIFECFRRHRMTAFSSVYDRRRLVCPDRCPPPLRKRRGWLHGYLGFEWWRLRISDEEYNKESLEEMQREKRNRNKSCEEEVDPMSDEFLREAELQCFEESPFRNSAVRMGDPIQERENDVDKDETHNNDSDCCCEPNEPLNEPTLQDPGSPIVESPKESEYICAPHTPKKYLFVRNQSEGTTTTVSTPTDHCNSIRKLSLPMRKWNDENRKKRLCEEKKKKQENIPFGSSEAERFMRLQYTESEHAVPDWDVKAFKTAIDSIWGFLKKNILSLHDNAENDEDAPQVESRNVDTLVASKIRRRPLNKEQQELLRCVGLDTFMTLRFLDFGFRVSLWPLLLSLFTLMPIYRTGTGAAQNGFFSLTVLAIGDSTWRISFVGLFAFVQHVYMLRQIWIEWELFLPLRYDFLENGDFTNDKYKEQYRKTCTVEHIPRVLQHGDNVYKFFDAVFPGTVKRAEVLLHAEKLSSMIKTRHEHIVAFEEGYAKKVHQRAEYLRDLADYSKLGAIQKHVAIRPRKPKEPRITVSVQVRRRDGMQNAFYSKRESLVRDARTFPKLEWHYKNIQYLNVQIENEFYRLAQSKRIKTEKVKESRIAKWLGVKYITKSGKPTSLHSSTAFVEFTSLEAKQHAVQCNITGSSNCLRVLPVPETRDIIWENQHVSETLISTRRAWMDVLLTGGLLSWSLIVAVIRQYNAISTWLPFDIPPAVASFLNVYVPALIVEGLVRSIPLALRVIVPWVREKSASATDHYILRWYFGYRLLTFIFVIVGGSFVEKADELVNDPIGLLRTISDNVVENSAFFCTYIVVTGGIQIFFRFSQIHIISVVWFVYRQLTKEAVSGRRLEELKTNIQYFHLDEFIPLFIFIWTISALYGALAPISGLFVACFFYVASKVFKFMTLYVYGKKYEGGGFLFYTMSNILFIVTYLVILVLAGSLSAHGTGGGAIAFLLLLPITYFVQRVIFKTFVKPSMTLSLARARAFDEQNDKRTPYERKWQKYRDAKKELENISVSDHGSGEKLLTLVTDAATGLKSDETSGASPPILPDQNRTLDEDHLTESQLRKIALLSMQRRYQENESMSDVTDDCAFDFFVYRQPSLNQATWEYGPRPYRKNVVRRRSPSQTVDTPESFDSSDNETRVRL